MKLANVYSCADCQIDMPEKLRQLGLLDSFPERCWPLESAVNISAISLFASCLLCDYSQVQELATKVANYRKKTSRKFTPFFFVDLKK